MSVILIILAIIAIILTLIADKKARSEEKFPTIRSGVVLTRTLAQDRTQEYFLYVPKSGGFGAPVFVSIHGINRNAQKQAELFAPFAESFGAVLIAPVFPKIRFSDYQRLGREGKGERADRMLERIVSEVGSLTGARIEKLYMFGYSGGAQFVHRYALAHPHRAARIVLAAAGWYTFPDPTVDYPLGIGQSSDLRDVQLDPARFLSVPTCVLVGEWDVIRDHDLRKSRLIDRQQGTTRVERGRRWTTAMTAFARAYQMDTPYIFNVLGGCAHSFEECMTRGDMGARTFEFLFGAPLDKRKHLSTKGAESEEHRSNGTIREMVLTKVSGSRAYRHGFISGNDRKQ